MEKQNLNVRSVALTFAGSFLGAGYVSGQELWQFFGAFGARGLVGVAAAMVLLVVAYSVLLSVMTTPETAEAELPMLALAYTLSRPLGYLYGILLLLCMYGSALSMTVAIVTYASGRSPRITARRTGFIVVLGACAFAGSLVGFGDLIGVVYPIFGYCSSLFLVCLLIHAAQVRREERRALTESAEQDTLH